MTSYKEFPTIPDVNKEAESDDEPPAPIWAVFFFSMKVLFWVCMVLQTLLWPCAMTMTVLGILVAETVLKLLFSGLADAGSSLTNYGLFFLRKAKPNATLYIFSALLGIYTLAFFLLFAAREMHTLPRATQWIHPDYVHNYSFTETKNNAFKGLDVRDGAARYMRERPFTWPRSATVNALRLNGTLPRAGPLGVDVACGGKERFECYAAKLTVSTDITPPRIVPMPSQFYTTDVVITPPSRMSCASLEAYRIVYDADRNIEYGLDYPASAPPSGAAKLRAPKCNLFGVSNWCLLFSHSFSDQEYTDTVQKKCEEGGGRLVFRLPPRSVDIEPETGRIGLDALLVTPGASVSFRHTWHDRSKETKLLSTWGKWADSAEGDGVQAWRTSAEGGPVFVRYVVAVTPFLMVWMYLAVHFEGLIHGSEAKQLLSLSIFVLLPSSLLFFVVGAWIPLAGCIVCVMAINSSVNWFGVRTGLLLLTLMSNIAQFVFILVIIGVAGLPAFMYEDSLQQIQEQLGGVAFLSGSPTWLTLMLPSTLVVNGVFALGSITCIVFEIFAARATAAIQN